jgi:peptidoglycan glycosyltransferase
MKKIRNRSVFSLLIAAVLVAGLTFLTVKLAKNGRDWAMFRADQSVFNEGVLSTGTVTDRGGIVLATAADGKATYAADATVRKACLHAVGDWQGNIGTGALSVFNFKLAGYDMLNGVASLNSAGGTAELSIDSKLNVAALSALGNRRGAVLLENYKTGEILCMLSTPTYDPANPPDLSQPAYEGAYLNRCLSSTFTPGSVFKLVTLAAAIENRPDLESEAFECAGSVKVGADTVNCTGVHGNQTIEQALSHSCNCAFSQLSQELGADVIASYADKLGLTKKLSVSGIATAAGSVEKGQDGTVNLSWMGIGQYNDQVTPIAMLRLASAIANGGEAEEPVLLKGAHTSATKLMEQDTADRIKDMMAYNVTAAYGASRFPGLSLCAKTGTAERGDGTSNAWFVGFLNDSDHPYAVTVCIEKGGGGLANAGPVANAVLQAAVAAND